MVTRSRHRTSSAGHSFYMLLLMYCLLTPWAFIPVSGSLYITTADALFPLALLILIVAPSLPVTSTATLTVVYLAWAVLQSYFSASLEFEPARLYRLAAVFMVLVLSTGRYSLTTAQFNVMIKAFWCGLFIAIVGAIILHLAGIQVRDAQQQLWVAGGGSSVRLAGVTGNTAEFGHISALWILTTLFFGKVLVKQYHYVLKLFAIALYAWITVLSSSRASIIDVFSALLLFFMIHGSSSAIRGVRMAALACAAFLVYCGVLLGAKGYSSYVDTSLARIDFLGLAFASADVSSDTRLSTWNAIIDDPTIGVAVGHGYKSAISTYGNAADNSLLSNYADFGLIGLLLFVAVMLALLINVARSQLLRSTKIKVVAILGGTLAHGLTLDFHTLWASTPALFAILVCSGKVASLARGQTQVGRTTNYRFGAPPVGFKNV